MRWRRIGGLALVVLVLGGGTALLGWRASRPSDGDRAQYLENVGGLALQRDGDPQTAEVHLLAALAIDPERTNARYFLAEALFAQSREDEAVSALHEGLARAPRHGACNLRLAQWHTARREFGKALQFAGAALRSEVIPDGTIALVARLQIAVGDLPAALESLRQAAEFSGTNGSVTLGMAHLAELLDQLSWSDNHRDQIQEALARSEARAETALRRNPDAHAPHRLLAEVRLMRGEARLARSVLPPPPQRGALPLSDLLLRAWLLDLEGDGRRAVEILEVRHQYDPSPVLLETIAQLHLRQYRRGPALAALRGAQDAEPATRHGTAWEALLGPALAWSEAEHGLLPALLERPLSPGNRFAATVAVLAFAETDDPETVRARLGALGPHVIAARLSGAADDHPLVVQFEAALAAVESVAAEDAIARTWRAALALARGDEQQAIELTRSLSEDAPEITEARWVLGLALSRAGEHEEALAVLRSGLVTRRPRAAHDAAVGQALLSAGRAAEAVRWLRESETRWPANQLVAAALARALIEAPDAAAPNFSPHAPEALDQIAELVRAADPVSLRRAKDYLEQVRLAGAPDREVLLLRGRILLAQGRARAAGSLARTLFEEDPRDTRARDLLIDALENLGDSGARYALVGEWLAAGRAYEARFDENPKDALVARQGVTALRRAGALDKAEALARRALAETPGDPALRVALARTLTLAGRIDEAEGILRELLVEDPHSLRAALALAEALRAAGREDEARTTLRTALASDAPLAHRLEAGLRLLAVQAPEEADLDAVRELLGSVDPKLPRLPAGELLRGHLYLAERRDADAVVVARQLVEADAEDGDAHLLVAAALARTGELDLAARHARQAVEASPGDLVARLLASETALLAGREAERVGDTARALPLYEGAIQDVPNDSLAMGGLVRLLRDYGGVAAARETRTRLEQRLDTSPAGCLLLARYLESSGQEQEAAPVYISALNIRADDLTALGALARLERLLDDPSTVSTHLDVAGADPIRGPIVRALRGAAADQDNALEEAETLYREALDLLPGNLFVHSRLVDVLVRAGKDVEARELAASIPVERVGDTGAARLLLAAGDVTGALEMLTPLGGTDAVAAFELGRILQRAGKLESAESHLRRAVALAPRSPVASLELLTLWTRTGRAGDADKFFAAAELQSPDNPVPACMRGILALRRAAHEDAVAHLERAVQLAPGFALAQNNLAWVLGVDLGRVDAALPHARAARARFPTDAEAADTLGWLLHLGKRDQEALPHLSDAVRRKRSSAPIRLHLAEVLRATGRTSDARAAYQRVLELDPAFAARAGVQARIDSLE